MTGNQMNFEKYLIGIIKGKLSPDLMIDKLADLSLEEIKAFFRDSGPMVSDSFVKPRHDF